MSQTAQNQKSTTPAFTSVQAYTLAVITLVIGIAVAMIPLAQNVGYAIPINELLLIIDDLKEKRLVRKLFFGVRFAYANDEKALFLHNPMPAGLYITSVFPGTIADHAGVQAGDMLYAVGDFTLNCYGEIKVPWSFDYISFAELINRMKVGDEVSFVIYRNGERKDMLCVMKELTPFAVRRRYPEYEVIEYDIFAGMVVMELTESHFELLLPYAPHLLQFNAPEKRINPVLIITHIIPFSYVYQLGILPIGSIITHVNGIPVSTIEQWKKATTKKQDQEFVTIMTSTGIFVVLSLQKIKENEKHLRELDIHSYSE